MNNTPHNDFNFALGGRLVQAGGIQCNKIEAGVIDDPDGKLEALTADFIRDLEGDGLGQPAK